MFVYFILKRKPFLQNMANADLQIDLKSQKLPKLYKSFLEM